MRSRSGVRAFANVTASYRRCRFTADHLALFKQIGIERVLSLTIVTTPAIALDNNTRPDRDQCFDMSAARRRRRHDRKR